MSVEGEQGDVVLGETTEPTRRASRFSDGRAWWAVSILMLLQTVSLVDRNILSLMIIEVSQELGLNDFQISLLQGLAISGFYVVMAIVIGSLIDRSPAKRRILYLCVTIWSLAATSVGLLRNVWGIVAARMMTGAGEGGVSPVAQTLITSLFPKSRVSLPMSLFTISGAFGIGLSYLGGGVLLQTFSSHPLPGLESLSPWRQVVIVTSAPGLLIALLSFTIHEPKPHRNDLVSAVSWGQFGAFLIQERKVVGRLLVGYGLIAFANLAMSAWAPTYARRVLHLTSVRTGLEMGLVSTVIGILSAAGYGALVDWRFAHGHGGFAQRAFVVGVAFAMPVCVLGFTLNQHGAFVIALIVAQCLMVAPLGPGMASMQMVTPPEMRGRMGALIVVVASFVGLAGGPMLVGAFTDYLFHDPQKVGWSIALTVVLVAPLAMLSIWSARSHFEKKFASLQ